MITVRNFLFRASLLLSLAAVTGCVYVLNVQPQETRGGFTVSVGVAGQPTAPRVVTDIGTLARWRGFVLQGAKSALRIDPATHQPLLPAPQRYLLGKIVLDVICEADGFRVSAYLHSPSRQLDRKFIDGFYQTFHQEYASSYGEEDTIIQTDYSNESGGPPAGGGELHGGAGHGGGGS